tara:strand:- start:429 stop:545 length:117 start_codon:yes stop_codon:yes gene_type:complete
MLVTGMDRIVLPTRKGLMKELPEEMKTKEETIVALWII